MFQLNQIASALCPVTGKAVASRDLTDAFLSGAPVTVLFKDGSFAIIAEQRVAHGNYAHHKPLEKYLSLVLQLDSAYVAMHDLEQRLKVYDNAPAVDLSTIEVGDKVVYRSNLNTKYPVSCVESLSDDHYKYGIKTAIRADTYTVGGSVYIHVQDQNDIVEVIKVAEPKLPIVDLGTVESGDQVLYRQGSTHTVEYVSKQDNLLYEFRVSTNLFTQTYTEGGRVSLSQEHGHDIVEVIKSK